MSNKKKITISGVLEMLQDGKKRPEIAEELGISMAECTKLFKHPKLKGKKALKPVSFEVVDDTEVAEEQEVEAVAVEAEGQEEVEQEQEVQPIFQNN